MTLIPCAGSYTHHYPICVRRVLPDDTLMSMASGENEDCYAISIVSCARPSEREGYFRFSEHLTRTMAALFEGRLHWDKHCPLDPNTVATLYPHLSVVVQIGEREMSVPRAFRNDSRGIHIPRSPNGTTTHLSEFRSVCSGIDPTGRFRNEWATRLLFSDSGSD